MPSAPNGDSPFLPERLQALLGPRTPGTPSSVGTPDVQAGGFNIPAPPSPASAPVGRPAGPSSPAPAAATPSAPTPDVSGGTASAPVAATPASGGEAAAAPTPAGVEQMRAAQDMAYRQMVVQKRKELGSVPTLMNHPSFGPLPYIPGQYAYNPFSNKWVK